MKSYPSIPLTPVKGLHYHFFDKLDGSNIRAEWSAKDGLSKFGTRRELIQKGSEFERAIPVIRDLFEDQLSEAFRRKNIKQATCFFEWFGPSSFAGKHLDAVKQMSAVLIDVNIYRRGFMPPEEFISFSEPLVTPIYLGLREITPTFTDQVRNGSLEGVTFEGVVGKTVFKNQFRMVKIKSTAWLKKLKEDCLDEEEFLRRA